MARGTKKSNPPGQREDAQMLRRYRVQPRAWIDIGECFVDKPRIVDISVFEPDKSPQKTGLVDRRGNELFAIEERAPIGFVRFLRRPPLT